MNCKYLIIPALLSIVSPGHAQTEVTSSNDSHYSFLDLSASSHIHGLGGVNISTVEDNIMTVDQNPALLGREMSNQLGLSYMHYLTDNNFVAAAYSHSAGRSGAWQASIRFLDYGKIDGYDENGVPTGRFAPSDLVISGGYTRDLADCLRGGFMVKTIYSSYADYSALALAADLGVNYYDPDRDLSLSAVISNLGGQVKRFDTTYNRLPADFRLGWSQSFSGFPVRFSVTAFNLTKWHLPYYDPGDGSINDRPHTVDNFGSNLMRHLVFGADIIPSDKFHIALGYNNKTRTDMSSHSRDFLSGFSIASGLKLKGFNIDVAFSRPYSGASVMMLNLTLDMKTFLR